LYRVVRHRGDAITFIHTRDKEAKHVATTRKPKAKPKVEVEVDEDEELEELEDELDELEALADEDDEETEDEDTDDEDEDDDEEAPKAKKKSKKTSTKKKRESTIYGTAELAEDLETDGKNLRVMLRDIGANATKSKKNPHGSFNDAGRYEWEDLDDALETLGFDDVDEAIDRLKEARNTRLDALKERNASKKKKTAKKVKPVVDEAEDEDEDEDEAPAPKKRTRRSSK
jgi:hypothetical protein